MPKRFTLAEAKALIPRVSGLLRDAIARKEEYDEAERAIQAFQHRVMVMGGMTLDRESVLQARKRREAALESLRTAIQEVQDYGCVVKDLDIGLIDFPTTFRGEEVYLCWKLGEEAIRFWHGVDEGFRGRKVIDQEFLDHHEGDREQ
jgi:hypothetical protein